MSKSSLPDWFATAQGQYLLAWEQAKFDNMVSDIFGYNAVQIELPAQPFLRNSRISHQHRCAACGAADVQVDAHMLPFASASLDLVLLPHVLEFSAHPHHVLREVERVLVPEGSVIIAGLNPYSLWGLHRRITCNKNDFPWRGHYLSLSRIKDWLTLLGFDIQSGGFGCYTPAVTSEKWLRRWHFMDKAGDRWWPVCGGAYIIQGIKRTPSMRLLTPDWQTARIRRRMSAFIQPAGKGVAGHPRRAEKQGCE